jgi:hypothetical protein
LSSASTSVLTFVLTSGEGSVSFIRDVLLWRIL